MGIKTPNKPCHYGECDNETCDQMNGGGCIFILSESRLFYRNPKAVEELREKIAKGFWAMPDPNPDPEKVKAEVERLQKIIEKNRKNLGG